MLKSVNLEREKKNELAIRKNDMLKISIDASSKKSVRFEHNIPEPTRLAKIPQKKFINLQHSLMTLIQGTIKRFSGFLGMIRKKNIRQQPKEIEGDKKMVSTDKVAGLLRKKLQSVSVDHFRKRGSKHMNFMKLMKPGTISDKPRNYLWIVFYVKKFICILKTNVVIKKLRKLKPYHYNIIGDKTYFDTSYEYIYNIVRYKDPLYSVENISAFNKGIDLVKTKVGYMTKIMQEHIKKINIFQPDEPFILLWNFIMFFFVLVNAFYIPLKIGFELDPYEIHEIIYFIVETFSVWVFIFDIFIILNTAYFSKGMFIQERFMIFKHYLKYSALFDFLSLLPSFINYFTDISFIQTLFILRIIKLRDSVKKFEDFLQIRDLQNGIFELIKLLTSILYAAHLCCCSWHYLAIYQISNFDNVKTWLHALGIQDAHWMTRYVNSLYFSIVSMVTVGYGDIVPQNVKERLFTIGLIVIACGMFAYSVNEVGNIVKEMYRNENEFKTKIKQVNSYMKHRGLNKSLQMRVQKYLEYMHEEDKFGHKKGESLLASLSNTLRKEVVIDIYGKILLENKFFGQSFSRAFINELAPCMKETTFAAEDTIIEENKKDDHSMYFIIKGEIEIIKSLNSNTKQTTVYQCLKKGDAFGNLSFLTGDFREVSAKSLSVSHLAFITKNDFLEKLKDFPDDFEKYRMAVDNVKNYNKISELSTKCESCGTLDHLTQQCGLFLYKPISKKVIEIYLDSCVQIRRRVSNRRKNKFKNTIAQTIDRAMKYGEDNAFDLYYHSNLYLNSSILSGGKANEDQSSESYSEESSKEYNPFKTNMNNLGNIGGFGGVNNMPQIVVNNNMARASIDQNKFLSPLNFSKYMGGGNKRESNAGMMSMQQRGSIKKPMKGDLDLGEQSVALNLLKKIYSSIKNNEKPAEEPIQNSMIFDNDEIMNLDVGKNFKYYFPKNNLDCILQSLASKQKNVLQTSTPIDEKSTKRKKKKNESLSQSTKKYVRNKERGKGLDGTFIRKAFDGSQNTDEQDE